MKLEDEFRAVLGDYFNDPAEREGLLANLMYYVGKYNRGLAGGMFVLGMLFMSLLLKWLS